MEFIVINGEPVPVPPEVVSEGRDAVAAWAEAEARRRQGRKPAFVPAEGEE